MFVDYGLLLLRVVVGLMMVAHGAQKAFGWFQGGGPQGTVKMMQSLNIYPPVLWAYVNAIAEFFGGMLTALGLLWPIGPLLVIGNMTVAIAKVHWSKGFWSTKGGYEFPLLILANALVLGVMGAGTLSLDSYFKFALPEPQTFIVGLIIAWVGTSLAVMSSERFQMINRHASSSLKTKNAMR